MTVGEHQAEYEFEGDGRSNELAAAFHNAVTAVRRRWWLVLGVFIAVVSFSTWRTARQPRKYQSAAVVQLGEMRRPLTVEEAPTPYDWRVDPIQSAQEIIKSQEIAERVANELGLRLQIVQPVGLTRFALFGDGVPQVDSAVTDGEFSLSFAGDGYELRQGGRTLSRAPLGQPVFGGGVTLTVPRRPSIDESQVLLEVKPVSAVAGSVRYGIVTKGRPQTNIVEIAYTGYEPALVQQTANGIAVAYRGFSTEERRKAALARTQIILESLRDQRLRLDSVQSELQAFKERQKLSNVGAEQAALAEAIRQFESQRDEVLVERSVYERLTGGLLAADTTAGELRRLAGTPALEKNQYISRLYNAWLDLVKRREELTAQGYASNYKDVRTTDSLIAKTKNDLRAASGLYLQGIQSRIGSLEARIASLRSEMGRYPSLEAQEQKLAADVRMTQNVYEGLQADFQRARISQSIDESSVRIVDRAPRPTAPISPNRRRIFITAVVFGLLLGLGAAVAVEQLDDSVKSPDEVRERFDLTVLGTIPEIREAVDGKHERLVTHLDPRSPVAEAYRSLRTNLAFARAHQALRTMVLTSPGPADGKSTTVSNLAITFAQQGQRTLVIDADLRRAVLDKLFEVPREPGLTDVLVGQAKLLDVVHESHIPNLFVVGSGPFPPNPSELLGSSAMRDTLREAQEHFDIVLLDSPPLLAVTDAAVLSTMVDGAVLVIRIGSTPRTSVRRATAQLQTVHGRLIGSVINDVDFKRGGYGAGYGYYYYYYYGQDGRGGGGARGVLDRVKQWRRAGAGASRES